MTVKPRNVLARRPRLDREGVDVGLHQRAECGVDLPVSGNRGLADEGGADDLDREVAATVARAGVPDVLVAVVDDTQPLRLQGGAQRRFDALDPRLCLRAHGSTGRNGRTSTPA